MAGLAAARMSGGSEFHAAGPVCEKVCSPNLVRSRGIIYRYLLLDADRKPVHQLQHQDYEFQTKTKDTQHSGDDRQDHYKVQNATTRSRLSDTNTAGL